MAVETFDGENISWYWLLYWFFQAASNQYKWNILALTNHGGIIYIMNRKFMQDINNTSQYYTMELYLNSRWDNNKTECHSVQSCWQLLSILETSGTWPKWCKFLTNFLFSLTQKRPQGLGNDFMTVKFYTLKIIEVSIFSLALYTTQHYLVQKWICSL